MLNVLRMVKISVAGTWIIEESQPDLSSGQTLKKEITVLNSLTKRLGPHTRDSERKIPIRMLWLLTFHAWTFYF